VPHASRRQADAAAAGAVRGAAPRRSAPSGYANAEFIGGNCGQRQE